MRCPSKGQGLRSGEEEEPWKGGSLYVMDERDHEPIVSKRRISRCQSVSTCCSARARLGLSSVLATDSVAGIFLFPFFASYFFSFFASFFLFPFFILCFFEKRNWH
jgi:hypothetical protein